MRQVKCAFPFRAVGDNRPVFGVCLVREVPLQVNLDGHISWQVKRLQHVVAIVPHEGSRSPLDYHRMLELVVFEHALVRDASLVPSKGLQIHSLVNV